jgi:hypothetical protein
MKKEPGFDRVFLLPDFGSRIEFQQCHEQHRDLSAGARQALNFLPQVPSMNPLYPTSKASQAFIGRSDELKAFCKINPVSTFLRLGHQPFTR